MTAKKKAAKKEAAKKRSHKRQSPPADNGGAGNGAGNDAARARLAVSLEKRLGIGASKLVALCREHELDDPLIDEVSALAEAATQKSYGPIDKRLAELQAQYKGLEPGAEGFGESLKKLGQEITRLENRKKSLNALVGS